MNTNREEHKVRKALKCDIRIALLLRSLLLVAVNMGR